MSDNLRRPSGIEVNGIPSADEIIALGRCNIYVAQALACWHNGQVNFDEALRVAVWNLVDSHRRLHEIVVDLSARAFADKIDLKHPREP